MIRDPHDPDWWRQAVVYQIYPRSFADANGDGLGDLRGVTSRVSYLRDLGVDAVWLSPFYPSPLTDGGYDVADYRNVDPRLGTLADFDELSVALHAHGIKLIVDIVPNHTSDQHPWFQEALDSPPGSPARARYHFAEGRGEDGELPPSDWESVFGGPAWHRTPDGQWYLHLFTPEQPDLNWENPEVRQDFLDTLRFWADRGVDGFRVDVAHALAKDLSHPLPATADLTEDLLQAGHHPFWDRDEVHAVYAEWRALFDTYDPPRTAVAEAWVVDRRRARYASPDGLGQAFNFDLLESTWDAGSFRDIVTASLEFAEETGASSTWVLSNHDVIRHASRYGLPGDRHLVGNAWLSSNGTDPVLDAEQGLRRARAATLFLLALPGSAYLYQGEELGLHEVPDLTEADLQDPVWRRTQGALKGRDGCRVPLPWTRTGSSYGFGSDGSHLPQPAWFGDVSVEAQDGVAGSTLELYRTALRLRAQLLAPEQLTWHDVAGPVLHFSRPGGWQVVTNFGSTPVGLPAGEVLLASGPQEGRSLPAETTVWLRA